MQAALRKWEPTPSAGSGDSGVWPRTTWPCKPPSLLASVLAPVGCQSQNPGSRLVVFCSFSRRC